MSVVNPEDDQSPCRRGRWWLLALAASGFTLAPAPAAGDPPSAPAVEDPAGSDAGTTLDDLLEAGQQLWEENAPEEIQAQYRFPEAEDLKEFLAALEADMADGDFKRLASYEPDARRALSLLRLSEEGTPLADWLEPRLDLLVAARRVDDAGGGAPVQPPSAPAPDGQKPDPRLTRSYWERIIAGRSPPGAAAKLVPRLKEIFQAEGVAPAWVWIAEVESSMNPRAESPVGARGLFQFMPATAERFGLSVSLPDERTDPEKSARAAATYLRILYGRFGTWSLALAAYNAGEGRVARTLKKAGATSFEQIAGILPAETRLYVPKVLATVAVRESVDPDLLPAPFPVAVGGPAGPPEADLCFAGFVARTGATEGSTIIRRRGYMAP